MRPPAILEHSTSRSLSHTMVNSMNNAQGPRALPLRSAFQSMTAAALLACFGALLLGAAGCANKTNLMPTPLAYTHPDWNPYGDVPPALQGDTVSVLYVTDRSREANTENAVQYGSERSRSAAFGNAVVKFGTGLTWDQIVKESRTAKRAQDIEITLTTTEESGRFAETPPTLVLTDAQMAAANAAKVSAVQAEAEKVFMANLSARLKVTPRKEVYMYIHGFDNSFADSVLTTAELWHFFGRQGVPVCYTWPAGVGGLLAYEYTLDSTQFTIYHLKQAIRLMASNPDVQKINIIAHSRGTAVATDAVRELYLEFRATQDVQKYLKLGTVILAAPDIDLDVVIQRNATERIGRAVERSAVYMTDRDKALGFSGWLFGGVKRLGDADPKIFTPDELNVLRHSEHFQLIDAQVSDLGDFGHLYFRANPSVSSDVVTLMRFGSPPGAQYGRPLTVSKNGLWAIEDGYPGKNWTAPTGTPAKPPVAQPAPLVQPK